MRRLPRPERRPGWGDVLVPGAGGRHQSRCGGTGFLDVVGSAALLKITTPAISAGRWMRVNSSTGRESGRAGRRARKPWAWRSWPWTSTSHASTKRERSCVLLSDTKPTPRVRLSRAASRVAWRFSSSGVPDRAPRSKAQRESWLRGPAVDQDSGRGPTSRRRTTYFLSPLFAGSRAYNKKGCRASVCFSTGSAKNFGMEPSDD